MKKLTVLFAIIICAGLTYGQGNTSYLDQIADGHVADVDQTGLNNYSRVLQTFGYNTADIDQIGQFNYSYLEQINGSGIFARIYQAGGSNISSLLQDGDWNWAVVYQYGDDNVLKNSKHRTDLAPFAKQLSDGYGDHNYLYLDQWGADNEAGVYQGHNYNFAQMIQWGSLNQADVYQDGPAYGAGNYAYIWEQGDNNWAEIYQEGVVNCGNYADIDVVGYNNGDGTNGDLWMDIIQQGDYNTAYTRTTGDNNDADVWQGSFYNFSIIYQWGNFNLANVNQQ